MSLLTLQNVVDWVQIHIPGYPQVKVGTALNLVVEEVFERLHQVEYTTITTLAPVTTGTVSATNGSATVTFSASVLATTDPLRIVQIGDDPTWYVLTRVSGMGGTLSSKYAGTTNATASHKIAYPAVTLPGAVGQVLRLHREGFRDLDYGPDIDPESYCRLGTVGAPTAFAPYSIDQSASPTDSIRYLLRPAPDATYALEIDYLARPTLVDPSSATPTTEYVAVPSSFRRAVNYGTLALCWLAEDRADNPWEMKAEDAFRKALATTGTPSSGPRRGVYAHRRSGFATQRIVP